MQEEASGFRLQASCFRLRASDFRLQVLQQKKRPPHEGRLYLLLFLLPYLKPIAWSPQPAVFSLPF